MLEACAIRFQGFKRRRGSLLEGRVVLLDRGQRFADLGPEFSRNLAQNIQDVFFLISLYLLFVENRSAAAALGAQRQYVLSSKAGNRAIQNSCSPGSLADFLGNLRSKPLVRLLAHQTQRLLDRLVGDHAEERRLLQLYRQPAAEGLVKHRIARTIGEIGEHNGVLVGEQPGLAALLPEEEPAGRQNQRRRRDSIF